MGVSTSEIGSGSGDEGRGCGTGPVSVRGDITEDAFAFGDNAIEDGSKDNGIDRRRDAIPCDTFV